VKVRKRELFEENEGLLYWINVGVLTKSYLTILFQ